MHARWFLGLALLLAPQLAEAQTAVRVSVHDARGALTPSTLRARWAPRRFADCQSTFLGGTLRLDVRIAPDGAVGVTSVRSSNESTAQYATCVRRVLARARFRAAAGETRVTLRVRFPPLGLGPRERAS